LRLPPGESIGAFMGHFAAHADCVLFNWVFFGPNGHKRPPAGGVLETYTRRDEALHPYTKYVARAGLLAEIDLADRARAHGFWHELGTKIPRPIRSVNVLGEDMARYYEGFADLCLTFVNEPARRERMLNTAVVHHYAFRSEAAFYERAARGLGGDFAGQAAWRVVADGPDFQRDLAGWNNVEDRRLADFWAGLLAGARASATRPDGVGGLVDLGGFVTIERIVVRAPARPTVLEVSIDGDAWVELARSETGDFTWAGPGHAWARFVRVARADGDVMAGAGVEIFARGAGAKQ
jgi:hypothetical protein